MEKALESSPAAQGNDKENPLSTQVMADVLGGRVDTPEFKKFIKNNSPELIVIGAQEAAATGDLNEGDILIGRPLEEIEVGERERARAIRKNITNKSFKVLNVEMIKQETGTYHIRPTTVDEWFPATWLLKVRLDPDAKGPQLELGEM